MNFDKSKLMDTFKGKLIFPGDADFDAARTVFYGGIDRKPAIIIRVTDANDIVNAIQLARTTGLELAVRSGGHSSAGFSVTDGGIVIDLKEMHKIEINAEEQTVWAESGLTAAELTTAVDKYNLVIGFGDTGSVGIGGITLGGGVGFLARKFGLTIDNLLAAGMVTADGRELHVDPDHHPDFFWAIRGGGGNFGVAARFKYKLHPLGQALGGMMLYPATAEAISGLMTLAGQAPDELTAIFNVMPAPPLPFVPAAYHGKLSVMALMMYAGDPVQGEKVMATFRLVARPLADLIKPMRYKDIFFPEDSSYHPTAVSQTMFLKSVDREEAATILKYLNASDAAMRAVQLRVLGGAISRVPADATAFVHRQSPIMANIAAFYGDAEDKKQRLLWVTELARELNQGDDGAYIGFLSNEERFKVRNAYPDEIWQKLRKVKDLYDPNNLFKLNFNIPPLKGGE